jgi:hypothetical protein
MVTDNQYSFGGVTMGAGTAYKVRSVSGLRGQPGIQSNDTPRLTADGDFSGYDTLTGRTITMNVVVTGTSGSDFETNLAALEAAMAPLLSTTSTFSYKFPNAAARNVQARPRKMPVTVVPSYSRKWQIVDLEWFCPDPTTTT